jgi:multidrug transporter EmrE-like cation transporter
MLATDLFAQETATVSIAGMLLFTEGVDTIKIGSLSFIVIGVVSLI